MTIALSDLIDDVLRELHGQTADQEQLTWLTQAALATDTSLHVNDASVVSRGLVEVEDEIMWVSAVDRTGNVLTVAPFGRGFRDTTAAAHAQNIAVMDNPRYPRFSVKTAIQKTLSLSYPDVFQVKTDETQTVVPVVTTYQVPADCDVITSIQWQSIGPSKRWIPVQRWRIDHAADSTVFTTGRSVDIFDAMHPGRTIKVTYIAQPGGLVNNTDTLSSAGLADSARDFLVYGACYRLVASAESARLQTTSEEQSERSQLTPPGSASNASKYFLALYQQALQHESKRLQTFYRARTHLTR